jgi:hypothetical protein
VAAERVGVSRQTVYAREEADSGFRAEVEAIFRELEIQHCTLVLQSRRRRAGRPPLGVALQN